MRAERNHGTAIRWFTRAAEQGFSEAQVNLAAMHENGQGTRKSRVEAYKWYLIAASTGLGKAYNSRDRLAGRMSKAQRREGQRLASDWLATHPSASENRGS